MHRIKNGSLIETKEQKLVYVLDMMDDMNFHGIDFETNQKSYFLTIFDIKRVVELPTNVKPLWKKRVEKIMGGVL